MKISIAWVFDHLNADYKTVDIDQLVKLFNQKVAEIEGYYTVEIPLDKLFIARVADVAAEHVQLHITQTNETIQLPKREHLKVGQHYLIKKDDKKTCWAMAHDFGGQKDQILPEIFCNEQQARGDWQQSIEAKDYIIEVDNKSITHRPDMWGYRGIAREFALLLDLKLKPLDRMITPLDITEYTHESIASDSMPFSVRIVHPKYIKRFAISYFTNIENRPSLPWMISRLCKVENRPINTLVDMTNYVMLDMGQPTHAFDAQKITTQHFEPRLAHEKETLTLLDDDTIQLTKEDIVITDGQQPIALAGVMGGKDSEITMRTTSMVLESANFDATTIRESAARHKKRTEASARFEKTLDPNQNIVAIERFVKLLQHANIPFEVGGVVSVGPKTEALTLNISHEYIEQRLGTEIASEKVVAILDALGCKVSVDNNKQISYRVTIPTSRCTKDIQIKEDILEEIARVYGYTNIPFVLPYKQTKPSDLDALYRMRRIKRLLAFGYDMREVYNYSFYDEDFLRELNWKPTDYISVQSPVSENWQHLVTSLIPGLLKNVWQNHADHEQLNFFESGRVWQKIDAKIIERPELAGIFYNQKKIFSFYDVKAVVQHIAEMIHMPLTYKKVDKPVDPWFAPYQTAHLMCEDTVVGTVGVIDVGCTHTLFAGHAAAFVFDQSFLGNFKPSLIKFKPLAKYPAVERDISMMVPLKVTVAEVTQAIKTSNDAIDTVQLVDMFQKDDWKDKKSLTFSFAMQHADKTLTTKEADALYEQVIQSVKNIGAEIR
ncbi:MAG: phenylalanine--tRNA ligase subunit beta [Candidatus Dependentiae bacterium]